MKSLTSYLFILSLFLVSTTASMAQRQTLQLLGVGGGKCETLINWATPLQQEFSTRGSYYSNDQFARSIILFSDEYFKPYFGNSYVDLSSKERKKYANGFTGCYQNMKYARQVSAIPEARNLIFAFSDAHQTGQWSQKNIMQALQEYQTEVSQYNEIKSYLSGDPDQITLSRINEIKPKLGMPLNARYRGRSPGTFKYIWPSNLEELSKLVEQKEPLAEGNEYRIQANALLSKENNLQTLREIQQFKNTSATKNSIQRKEAFIQKLEQKETAIIGQLMLGERSKLQDISSGKEGFDELNYWYNSFHNNYSHFRSNQQVQQLYDLRVKKSSDLLTSNQNAITSEIRSASTIDQLTNLRIKYLGGGDTNNQAHFKLSSLVQQKQREINQAATVKKQQMDLAEAKQLNEKLTAVTVTGEPTGFQMEWAYNYQIKAKNAEYDRDVNLLQNAMPDENYSKLVGLFSQYMSAEVRLESFEKLACEKAVGRPGYNCDFAAKSSTQTAFVGRVESSNNVKTGRFIRTESGFWQLVEYLND